MVVRRVKVMKRRGVERRAMPPFSNPKSLTTNPYLQNEERSMHHFKNDIFLFLLAFGRIHDVNQLDDTSQENQHAEHDNHVREADRKRARSFHRVKSTFL